MKGVSRKYNILFAIAVLLLAALGLGVFGACSYNNEEQNIIDRGWVYLVTYDAAGGSFDSTVTSETEEGSSAGTEYARVQANSLTVEPGYTPPGAGALNIIPVPQKTGYTLDGWYLVKEDGSLAVNAWDFSRDRVNSDITLRANWVKKGTLEFYAADRKRSTAPLIPWRWARTLSRAFTIRRTKRKQFSAPTISKMRCAYAPSETKNIPHSRFIGTKSSHSRSRRKMPSSPRVRTAKGCTYRYWKGNLT